MFTPNSWNNVTFAGKMSAHGNLCPKEIIPQKYGLSQVMLEYCIHWWSKKQCSPFCAEPIRIKLPVHVQYKAERKYYKFIDGFDVQYTLMLILQCTHWILTPVTKSNFNVKERDTDDGSYFQGLTSSDTLYNPL